ncbi:MAG: FAD-dependent oxidoreductase [Thermoleophilaceae bacterium]|nr:FAD-dependent oxidoreductase [Thermoleophilaceae bacterium]
MAPSPGTHDQPLRVAVVGSGPSGFYAAGHVLKVKDLNAEVDLFDRLPTPFGLVRAGVAPDHPKIKSVTRVYEKTAANPGFRFFGNVTVGDEISHADLKERYHAVIYAVGAQTDRHLGIPGEDLPGSWAATELVAWYNAHPDFADLEFDLSHKRAVVIGNGNVAMDVARMLVLPREELEITDTADHAIDALAGNGIEEVVIVGRRGPAQAAFTNPELLELGELTDADVIVDPAEMHLDEQSARSIEGEGEMTARKNVEILQEYSEREPAGKRKRVVLRFLRSPVRILGEDRVEGVELVRNELHHGGDGSLRARSTEEHETLDAGLVFRSIGYRGVPIDGVPFDEWKGTVPNEGGRVLDPHEQVSVPGVYVVGWIKRGPSGVIGTNKRDAQETVDNLIEDLHEGRVPEPSGDGSAEAIEALLAERKPEHVTYGGWERIDAVEVAAGESLGRPRVKLTRVEEMLEAAGKVSAGQS